MELVRNVLEYLGYIISAVIIVLKTNSIFRYYQQSHYHLNSFKRILKHYYLGKYQYLIFLILSFVFFLDKWYVGLLYVLYLVILIYFHYKQKDILKLKWTKRIYRNYFLLVIISTILVSTLLYLVNLPDLNSALALTIFFLPFLVFLSCVIIYPVEILIAKYYQQKAKRKLNKINPLIIGITGSYGKTTTKNFLAEFLKDKYITLATRKSFNTLNGISISINEDLGKETEVFIVEMGASHVDDLSKLLKLVKPNYAILTGITYQHLETFKTVQNIINEKIKIVEALDNKGIAVINGDDEFLKSIKINTKAKIIKFGFNSSNDYYATDIVLDKDKLSFTINYKNKSLNVTTNLVGKHNILNILASFALAKELGVSDNELVTKISMLELPNNRLKVEKMGTFTIIDDSFNSNNLGFQNALEVLSLYPSPKVLITPGIVEGGSLEFDLNFNIASEIKKVADEVVLIKTKASMHIYEGLKKCGYTNIKIVDSFVEGRNYVFEKYPKATILIENDVSDIYKI